MTLAWFVTLIVVISGAIIGAMVVEMIFFRRRVTRNLQSLATRLGLEFIPAQNASGQPQVAGVKRDRAVKIFYLYPPPGSYEARQYSVVAANRAGNSQLKLFICRRHLGTLFNQILGPTPLATGDEAFDQAWLVKTNDAEFIRAALTPERRARLMELERAGGNGTIELEPASVKYTEPGNRFTSGKYLGRFLVIVEVVCDMAEVAEGPAKG